MRLWVAILLTGLDIAVFEHFWGAIWLALAAIAWIRVVLVLLLVVWTGSAAVLWLHVFYDIRQILHQRRCTLALHHLPAQNRLRENRDV
jgi:hypothetical protein